MKNLEFYEDLNVDNVISFFYLDHKVILRIKELFIGDKSKGGVIAGEGLMKGKLYGFNMLYIKTKDVEIYDERVEDYKFASEDETAELEMAESQKTVA